MRRRRVTALLFALDLVALGAVAVAWAVSEMLGYSGRVTVGQRAFVFDTVMGELALWTGRVRTDAPIDVNRDGVANDERAPGGEPTTSLYERSVASRTWQWFDGLAGSRGGRGGDDVGIFALGVG